MHLSTSISVHITLLVVSLWCTISRVISSPINVEPKIVPEDNEYLCHHYYKDDFVISEEIVQSGCKLECVLLGATGSHGANFFDATQVKEHPLNEGLKCGERQICSNGTCIASNEPETGHAYITIFNASLPDKDRKSEGPKSDGFVKIYLDSSYLAKTKVIVENNEPKWRETFVTPMITSDTEIEMLVFDKDDNTEEFIIGAKTSAKALMESRRNGTLNCVPENSKFQFCYAIVWWSQMSS
ncbi:hypothetical protein HDE_13473 [Halotydeus destructor]|nr:hypothetical protein HDE_13473 [Halotydeus destructor]